MIDFFIRKFALVISIHVSKYLAIKILLFFEKWFGFIYSSIPYLSMNLTIYLKLEKFISYSLDKSCRDLPFLYSLYISILISKLLKNLISLSKKCGS